MPGRYCLVAILRLVASYGRNLWMSPSHENAAYLPP
jgi:hypothetical protein